jgi:hypothetical protein
MTAATRPRAPKSDSIAWAMMDETFTFMWSEWDVDAAKAIVQAKPRKIERIAVDRLEPFLSKRTPHETGTGFTIRAGIVTDEIRINTDETISLDVPLIVAITPEGNALPIDGWHRVAKAVALGVETLPLVYLTKAESKRVRL